METIITEKLSETEMIQIKGGEEKGQWILLEEGWVWIGPRDLGNIPPPPNI